MCLRRFALLAGMSVLLPAFSLTAQTSNAEWATPAEASNYQTTPNYAETMAYLRRVAAAAPQQVRIESFGKTGEGRDLNIVIASRDGVFDPAKLHAERRPILLVQNAIHAGEMDGKDSCLALLRDMVVTKTQAKLLDRAVFVFIPIYNADGHERRSPYNRINQNGPREMGWRGNGTNLNLNRDYMKVQAPETRAFFGMFEHWVPDFFVDDHVTDGADYQYDVTFTIDDGPNVASGTAQWIDKTLVPSIEKEVNASGHLAAPTYITLLDDSDPSKGLAFNGDPPRFSTGEMVLENRPAMLVELHMLKDYKTRVTGNYETLRALLEILNRDADVLIDLNRKADEEAMHTAGKPFPLTVGWGGQTTNFAYRGYKSTQEKSDVSGGTWIRYSHDPWNVTLPLQTGFKVLSEVTAPLAYIVPLQWTRVIEVLDAHRIEYKRTTEAWTGAVETYRCSGMQWQSNPFEGRHPLFPGEDPGNTSGKFGECKSVTEKVTYPAGSVVVLLNQRLSKVAVQWLEPKGPDSSMAWAFWDPIFEQKEYGEGYVEEKLAREMMAKDPALKTEFEKQVASDAKFAASPAARLAWFYDRSPWHDPQLGLYPVGRLTSLDGIPLEK
jgi:hypothetical protein